MQMFDKIIFFKYRTRQIKSCPIIEKFILLKICILYCLVLLNSIPPLTFFLFIYVIKIKIHLRISKLKYCKPEQNFMLFAAKIYANYLVIYNLSSISVVICIHPIICHAVCIGKNNLQ